MRKFMNLPFNCRRFYKDPRKEYIRKIRMYPPFLYNYLDNWLKKMSSNGWHIVHCGMFSFVFEKGLPSKKEYFTYGVSTQEGKYSISMRYPFLEKIYGVKSAKSPINSNKAKAYNILEIDAEKIDLKNDVGYKELIKDRNRLYLKYLLRNIGVAVIAVVAAVIIVLSNK